MGAGASTFEDVVAHINAGLYCFIFRLYLFFFFFLFFFKYIF
jgi:hypothetical protein